MIADQAFKRLPERFRKPNTYDLYHVLYSGFDELEQGFSDIKKSRNIDQATGKSLDYLGGNVGQLRQGEDDDLYRLLIKTRIIANLSNGDIPTINKVLSILTKDLFLGLIEVWGDDEYDREPAAFRLELSYNTNLIPFDIVDKIKSAGIRVIFDLRSTQIIKIKDKADAYIAPFYPVGKHYCGTVHRHQYTGIKVGERINVGNGSTTRKQRQLHVNEIQTRRE